MTFLQLRTLVWSWLDDPDGGYFTESEVNRWINNAQQEAQKLILQSFESHFEKCVETTTVINQREYQLPSDFKKLVRLDLIVSGTTFATEDADQLSKITSSQQDLISVSKTGTPVSYFFKNNQIILVPAPDAAKTLRMTYIYRLADMSNDSDESEIPIEYHEYLAVLATIDGLQKDGRDIGPMMAKKQGYETTIKRDAEQRNIDAPRTVVQTMDDEYYGDDLY